MQKAQHPERLHKVPTFISSVHITTSSPSSPTSYVQKPKQKGPHSCISPKKILISQAQIGVELRPPVSDAVTPASTGLPGTVLAHPLQLGRLARARGNEHWGVFNTQLYVEKPCGQYHTVILGEGFLDRITILGCINANPSFIYKRKES